MASSELPENKVTDLLEDERNITEDSDDERKLNEELFIAIREGKLKRLRYLLESGVKTDIINRNNKDNTPLHYAIEKCREDIVKELLDKKWNSDINVQNNRGDTPLHIAAFKNYRELVLLLISKKADIYIKNNHCKTPSDIAKNQAIINSLLPGSSRDHCDSYFNQTRSSTELGKIDGVDDSIAISEEINIINKERKASLDLTKNYPDVKNTMLQRVDKKNVVDIQIKQELQFNKRQGTSGISGQLYEIELSMLFLLHGVMKNANDKINSFYLATNMKEADDFDDVVFKSKSIDQSGIEKSKVIFLQAKHKDAKENEKEKKITIDTLLSKAEKGDFSLRKYLSSYSKIEQQFKLRIDHPIFESGLESCVFIIYTNAWFDFDNSRGNVNKEELEQENILNLKENNHYYKLIESEEVLKYLRNSLEYEILVRELAKSVFSGNIDGNKTIFKDYHLSLAESIIEKINQREGVLSDSFLDGEQNQEFRYSFFEEIQQKNFKGKSIDELKQELRTKKMQLPNKFGIAETNDLKLSLPSKHFSDETIKTFISRFRLFVNQPNESKLGQILKETIKSKFRVAENDIDTVFSVVEYRVRSWWKGGDEYLTENNKYFQESARVSVRYDVKEPVTFFTGRIENLRQLHEALQNKGEVVISQMASVTGLGGVGKSELARKYISEHSKDYDDNFLWINAESYRTFSESFRSLAEEKLHINNKYIDGREKDIKTIVEEVYKFFSKRKVLFVFDNAERYKSFGSGDEGIDKFLPSGPNKPYILITSRYQEWGQIKSLPLDVFTEEEAIEFIMKALHTEIQLQEIEIIDLARTLQYFPLALRQAVAYINMENKQSKLWSVPKFRVKNYVDKYKKEAEKLLKLESSLHENDGDRYTKTVLTTWNITIGRIRQKICGKTAVDILDIMAYFAPDKIPIEGIFSKLVSDNEELHNAVELLDKYSMANLEQGILNIHRLVQQVTRLDLMRQNKAKHVLKEALTLLKEPLEHEQCIAKSNKYTSHGVSAWDHVTEFEDLVKDFGSMPICLIYKLSNNARYEDAYRFGEEAYKLLHKVLGSNNFNTFQLKHNIGTVFDKQGKYDEALHDLREVADISLHKYGANNPYTLKIMNNIATVLDSQGKYDEALKMYQNILDKFKHQLNPDRSSIIGAMHNIAITLEKLGKYEDALDISQKVWVESENLYGSDNEYTLESKNNIGLVLRHLRKYDQALLIFEEIQNKFKSIYGCDHHKTLLAKTNVAGIISALGKHDEAIQIHRDILNKLKEILDPDNPDILHTRYNIACEHYCLKEYDKALEIHEEILNKSKQLFGQYHPNTLDIIDQIGSVLCGQKKFDAALRKYLEVLEKRAQVFDNNHPRTLEIMSNLALVYSKQKKFDEALKLYQKILSKRRVILGPDHPDTDKTRDCIAVIFYEQKKYDDALSVFLSERKPAMDPVLLNMLKDMHYKAIVLDQQGKYDEALTMYKQVLVKKIHVLGSDHPFTLQTMHNMTTVLTHQGKYAQALTDFNQILERFKQILTPDHPITLNAMFNMAEVLDKQEKYDEALSKYQEVLNKRVQILNADHLDILQTKNNMAVVLRKQCKFDEASGIYEEILGKYEILFGTEHPLTLSIIQGKALVLVNLRRYKEALENMHTVLKIRKQIYKTIPDHPHILGVKHNIAEILDKLGNYDDALTIYKEVLAKFKLQFGPNHPFTSRTEKNIFDLVVTFIHQDNFDVAIRAFNSLNKNETFLRFTIRNGYLDVVKYLINEQNADVLANNNHDTILHQAVSCNNKDIIKIILDKIKEKYPLKYLEHIDAEDSEGDTPLMWAAEKGKTSAGRILLEYGANINATDKDGMTALHFAAEGGFISFIQLLLDNNNLKMVIKDKNGNTPIDLAKMRLAQDPDNNDFQTVNGLLLSMTEDF